MRKKKESLKKAQSLPSGDSATIATRPRRKADSIVKGAMHRWEGTDYAEFHPVKGKDEPTREMLKQVGNSSFVKNLGKKESSYSLHVNVDGESQDPVAEIYEVIDMLTAEQRKQTPKVPEGLTGRMLYDDGHSLKVWLDHEKGEVNILTRLECGSNIERMLLQAQSAMNVCIGRHRQEILNHEFHELNELNNNKKNK